eukprot:scaffold48_cov311-Pinguiococcus_pyrenoidosus.AAC.211
MPRLCLFHSCRCHTGSRDVSDLLQELRRGRASMTEPFSLTRTNQDHAIIASRYRNLSGVAFVRTNRAIFIAGWHVGRRRTRCQRHLGDRTASAFARLLSGLDPLRFQNHTDRVVEDLRGVKGTEACSASWPAGLAGCQQAPPTCLSPSCVRAEHSRYLAAPSCSAAFSPC